MAVPTESVTGSKKTNFSAAVDLAIEYFIFSSRTNSKVQAENAVFTSLSDRFLATDTKKEERSPKTIFRFRLKSLKTTYHALSVFQNYCYNEYNS